MSRTEKIATFGGEESEQVVSFTLGFASGAAFYNTRHPDQKPVRAFGEESYIHSFHDRRLGARMARKWIKKGAEIVFTVAGRAVRGALDYCFKSRKALFIGVDEDSVKSVHRMKSVILTSLLKRVDNIVADAVDHAFSPISSLSALDLQHNQVDLAAITSRVRVPSRLGKEMAFLRTEITTRKLSVQIEPCKSSQKNTCNLQSANSRLDCATVESGSMLSNSSWKPSQPSQHCTSSRASCKNSNSTDLNSCQPSEHCTSGTITSQVSPSSRCPTLPKPSCKKSISGSTENALAGSRPWT